MNRFLLTLFLLFVALPLVVLVIVAPMSANNQFLFGISMIVACIIAHICSKRHFVSFCILVVTVISSTRYMFFRLTQTLEFPSLIDMIFGYLLLAAELYVYMVLLLSFFQVTLSFFAERGMVDFDTVFCGLRVGFVKSGDCCCLAAISA